MSSDSEIELEISRKRQKRENASSRLDGLYLDTIHRELLDFDFEKICSVSMTNFNIYCCLNCGKYLQGRGNTSHAYYHALQNDHHVFMSLDNQRIYVLPENYEVMDSSLDDIKYAANPTYDSAQIKNVDDGKSALDLNRKLYMPGSDL